MTRTRVAIIGGGIGGLTAAVALRQRGFEVSVYEQSPQLGEIGAGVGVAPNAVKAFRALGLEKDLLAIGWTVEFDFVADHPGMTLFHCHQQLHMDFGFMFLFQYA